MASSGFNFSTLEINFLRNSILSRNMSSLILNEIKGFGDVIESSEKLPGIPLSSFKECDESSHDAASSADKICYVEVSSGNHACQTSQEFDTGVISSDIQNSLIFDHPSLIRNISESSQEFHLSEESVSTVVDNLGSISVVSQCVGTSFKLNLNNNEESFSLESLKGQQIFQEGEFTGRTIDQSRKRGRDEALPRTWLRFENVWAIIIGDGSNEDFSSQFKLFNFCITDVLNSIRDKYSVEASSRFRIEFPCLELVLYDSDSECDVISLKKLFNYHCAVEKLRDSPRIPSIEGELKVKPEYWEFQIIIQCESCPSNTLSILDELCGEVRYETSASSSYKFDDSCSLSISSSHNRICDPISNRSNSLPIILGSGSFPTINSSSYNDRSISTTPQSKINSCNTFNLLSNIDSRTETQLSNAALGDVLRKTSSVYDDELISFDDDDSELLDSNFNLCGVDHLSFYSPSKKMKIV
ncbi:hypothetical protein AYI68_g3138 [Smittium mucronatum]|uniref:Uncharacterized protein n=1 Tax=Smittium mucronatum TaxID=133383 RepID=A0A1R0H0R8_9FUNG|nr:hypothetical protein AYI68_g3138 [Smittium mucronatum]